MPMQSRKGGRKEARKKCRIEKKRRGGWPGGLVFLSALGLGSAGQSLG